MKKIFICLFILLCFSNLYAQYYYNPYTIYYDRQPSARAEAMGRGQVANASNDFGAFYNPASTYFSKGLTANVSFSDKLYSNTDAKYNYQGVNYNLGYSGSIGLSRYYMGVGDTEPDGDRFSYTLYTLNYSRPVVNNFFAGVNLNIISTHFPARGPYSRYVTPENILDASIDIGALKKFELSNKRNESQTLTFGASITNVSFTMVQSEFIGRTNLPVLLRAGAGYNAKFFQNNIIPGGNAVSFIANGEYEMELRHNNLNIFKGGGELTLYDILSLRGGVYAELYRRNNWQTYFTYGAGLNLPINAFTHGDLPFKVGIDYVNLKHPTPYSEYYDNFNVISMKINWIP